MEDQLPRGGVIRKVWIAQADLYRAHLLRLDLQSRRSRFAGAVSDQFLRDYAELAFSIDVIIHGFFVDGVLRGAAELRPVGAVVERPRVAVSAEGGVKHGVRREAKREVAAQRGLVDDLAAARVAGLVAQEIRLVLIVNGGPQRRGKRAEVGPSRAVVAQARLSQARDDRALEPGEGWRRLGERRGGKGAKGARDRQGSQRALQPRRSRTL